MKTKIFALGIILLTGIVFSGCILEKKAKTGVPIGEPIIDVSGMWIGQDCYLTLVQNGDKLDGTTKMRYTRATRQFKGMIDDNHIVLDSLSGNIRYDLNLKDKKMIGTYSDSNIVARPVTFKR